MKRTLAALAVALLPAAAQADDRWLHVAVDGDDETVRINLPIAVVAAAMPFLETHVDEGRLELDDHDLEIQDVRRLVVALNEAQDGEYVTIEDGADTVRIRKEGKFLHVDAKEGPADGPDEQVEVRMPIEVVAALVSGREDELNLSAALDALAKHGTGDLVVVRDGDETVRIWIDQQSAD